ncbi:Hypothetical protein A7982_06857 [Minicystis rosea]|nr:Hypothetical protein A7982_06857 [Minicystis rosea]
MSTRFFFFGSLAFILAACNADGTGSSSQAVVLDVRCAADTDCPGGFQCETEVEHGTAASYCVSDDSQGTSTGTCPAGYELETEHGSTFCKPHGGTGKKDGTQTTGDACITSADCASGLECEVETEHGVTTSFCKAHGG